MRTVAVMIAVLALAAQAPASAADPAARARGEAAGREVGSSVSSGFDSFAGEVEGFFNGLGQPSRPARQEPKRQPDPAGASRR